MSPAIKRLLAVVCVLGLALGAVACGDDDDAASTDGAAAGDTKLGAIVLTLQAEFYVAYEKALQGLAGDAGIELTVLDSDIKVEKQQENMEAMLTQGVNAISFSPVDDASAAPLIQQAKDQGASVVTLAVQTDLAPNAVEDSVEGGRQGGEAAASYFKEHFPDVPIKMALLTQPQLQQTVDRANGFVEGVKSVDPEAEVVVEQDGGGALDTATTTAEDMLQKAPDANLWFGINDPSALGALNALRSAGKGTIADQQLVVGFDGSAPALKELLDPQSALKVEIGNQPKVFAQEVVDNLLAQRDGQEVEQEIRVATELLTGDMSPEEIRQWYSDQWGSTLD